MATPFDRTPFVLSPPAAPVERHGQVDLHLPAGDEPRSAVVLVHGAPLPPGASDPRDWLLYRGYGALLAEQGLVAAVVSYRVDELTGFPAAAEDVAAAVAQVRAGRDMPPVLAGIEAFTSAAAASGRSVRILDVPDGRHGFDALDHTDQSRDAVRAARDAVVALLRDA
ncbi:hypothetical protein [Micromonospora palomenae]|uniref:hypothetical protein n=1 Tax=Micromonospora palomenae TaxID=1461247 RepID=UPI003F8BBCA9